MSKPTQSIADIEKQLANATQAHKEAYNASQHASRLETEALNLVNRLQKELDEAVATLRKGAVRASDWGQERINRT